MVDEEILMHYYEEIANKLDEMSPVEWTKIAMLAEDLGTSCAAGEQKTWALLVLLEYIFLLKIIKFTIIIIFLKILMWMKKYIVRY